MNKSITQFIWTYDVEHQTSLSKVFQKKWESILNYFNDLYYQNWGYYSDDITKLFNKKNVNWFFIIEYYKKDLNNNINQKKYYYIDYLYKNKSMDEKDFFPELIQNWILDNPNIWSWIHCFWKESYFTGRTSWLAPIQYYYQQNPVLEKKEYDSKNIHSIISNKTMSPFDLMTDYLNLILKKDLKDAWLEVYVWNKEKYWEWRFEWFYLTKDTNYERVSNIFKTNFPLYSALYFHANSFFNQYLKENPFTWFDILYEWRDYWFPLY